ncbi:hypothetical protein [Pontivivens nitratireducens]|nr:hypothetical protein [Pontibrevibacter nitratireducens]
MRLPTLPSLARASLVRVFSPADGGLSLSSGRSSDTPCVDMLTGRRVLIVEDEGLLALDLEFALIDAGATVMGPVIQVDEGLTLMATETGPIDAAILDLDLRGQPSYPLADCLIERGVPFVFHTGHGREADLRARYGTDIQVFAKPSRIEGVIAALAELIANRS